MNMRRYNLLFVCCFGCLFADERRADECGCEQIASRAKFNGEGDYASMSGSAGIHEKTSESSKSWEGRA